MNNRIKRNITIPDYILEIIKLFKDKNQEIYLVGGSVRDSILGIESSDYDLCTSMSINEIKLLFNEAMVPIILFFSLFIILPKAKPLFINELR